MLTLPQASPKSKSTTFRWILNVLLVAVYAGYVAAMLILRYADYRYLTMWTWTLQTAFFTIMLLCRASVNASQICMSVMFSCVFGAVWAVMFVSTAMNIVNRTILWYPGVTLVAIVNDVWMHYAPIFVVSLFLYAERSVVGDLLSPTGLWGKRPLPARCVWACAQFMVPCLYMTAWSCLFQPSDVYPTSLTNLQFWGIGIAGVVVSQVVLLGALLLYYRYVVEDIYTEVVSRV